MEAKGYAEIIERIKDFKHPQATNKLFDLIAQMIAHLGLRIYDNRVELYVRNDYRKRFSINLGNALVLALSGEKGINSFQFRVSRDFFRHQKETLDLFDVFGDEMKNPTYVVVGIDVNRFLNHPPDELVKEWLATVCVNLPKNARKTASTENYMLMWDMAVNREIRKLVFDQIYLITKQIETMKLMYTWVEAHAAIAHKLLNYRTNQSALIGILKQAGVDKFDDESERGVKMPLTEIDPFTFFSYIYKHGALRNKKTLREVCRTMHIDIDVKDICGVPTTDARNVWYFPYAYDRVNNELERLWNFFEKLTTGIVNDHDFQDVLDIRSVGKSKLLDGMFRISPYNFLCFNSLVNQYLTDKGIDPSFATFTELQSLQVKIQGELNADFPQLSYKAYLKASYTSQVPKFYRIGSTAGENGESVLPQMLSNNVASIGWRELGDLENLQGVGRPVVQNALLENGFYEDVRIASRKAGEIVTFYNIEPGDYILVAEGITIKAIGKVISDNYFFEGSFDFPHCRNVEWVKTAVSNLTLTEGLRTSVWQFQYPESIKAIREYLGLDISELSSTTEVISPASTVTVPSFPLNIILYGPPGTGKTYNSIDKAVEIINGSSGNHIQNKITFDELKDEGRIDFVTFHPNYTYEDFVVGIKPATNNSQLSFDKHEGIFYKLSKAAEDAYNEARSLGKTPPRFVLVVDEINRANIARVFGELITLIEEDKRIGEDNEMRVTLPNGEKGFGIPSNLYIIGTMNTADKSIALIDIALRRRFEFIGMYPDLSLLAKSYSDRIPVLETINRNIFEKRKSADYLLGHAYLLKDEKIENIIKKKIIPLLMEYFNGRIDEVASIFNGSGYKIQYDEKFYTWHVELNSVTNEVL